MSLPARHTIAETPQPGGPEAIQLQQRDLAPLADDEVLIETSACGVNKPDALERMGVYPPPAWAPEGLGLEVSGTIIASGESVSGWAIGDRVCALVSGGGYTDYAIAKTGVLLPVPENLPLEHAAGLPETVFTVWANVFESGQLQAGETLLVHGGAGGIGTTAIQMGVAAGARVIATAGTAEKCRLCRDLGAEIAVNYRKDDFVDIVRGAGGADVILDMVGGPYVQKNLSAAKRLGRLVQIAFLRGSRVEVDLMSIMLKRLTYTGSTLRSRSDEEKQRLASAIRKTVWPWVEAGMLKPVIDRRFALQEVRQAHERLDSGDHAGKILLLP